MSSYKVTNRGGGRYDIEDTTCSICLMPQIYDSLGIAVLIITLVQGKYQLDKVQLLIIGFFVFIMMLALFMVDVIKIILNILSCIIWITIISVCLFYSGGTFVSWSIPWKIIGLIIISIIIIAFHFKFYDEFDIPISSNSNEKNNKKRSDKIFEIESQMNDNCQRIGFMSDEIITICAELSNVENSEVRRFGFECLTKFEKIIKEYKNKFPDDEVIKINNKNLKLLSKYTDEVYEIFISAQKAKNNYYSGYNNQNDSGYIFFANCSSKEEADALYKSLIKAYHPDNKGGDNDMFIKMQQEYQTICKENCW